jgi:hypothetical protein
MEIGMWKIPVSRNGRSLNVNVTSVMIVGQWQSRADGCLFHARQRLYSFQNLPAKRFDTARIGVLRTIQEQAGREHVLGPEAGVDVKKIVEAANQQAGANKQNERERNLGNHEKTPQKPAAPAHCRSPAGFLERLGDA